MLAVEQDDLGIQYVTRREIKEKSQLAAPTTISNHIINPKKIFRILSKPSIFKRFDVFMNMFWI